MDRSGGVCARLSAGVAEAAGWRRALIAFTSGSLSVLAFAPFFAAPVLFLTLPVFVWLIDSAKGWRAAARDGWVFGFGFFFFNLLWIGEAFLVEADKFAVLLPFAVTLLPAGMAIFWGAAAGAARSFWPTGFARVLALAVALGVVEWLRGHLFTGLPWNVIGYALTNSDAGMQGAALVGVYGLTPLAVAIFATPLVVLAESRSVQIRVAVIACVTIAPMVALHAYGAWRLSQPDANAPGVALRIVQPSVPQREKWMAEHQRRIFEDHLALTATSAAGVTDGAVGVTHVVWPEAAMPFFPLERPEALTAIAETLPDGASLIAGGLRRDAVAPVGTRDARRRAFNSLIAFDDNGRPTAVYDKLHLVPFGEYLPFEPILSAVGLKKLTHGLGAFASGPSPRPVFDAPGLPTTLALICYEALFPGQIAQSAIRPGLLINVTNDGWFGDSTGPRQHFHQARVRAVEEGAPLVRAANNGISAIVDGKGRVLKSLGMNVRGVIDGPLPAAVGPTLYSGVGDAALAAILAAFAVAAWLIGRSRYA